jgi:hypothetical protein
MSDHLSPATLNALADEELAADELASVAEHLHGCSACTIACAGTVAAEIGDGASGPEVGASRRYARANGESCVVAECVESRGSGKDPIASAADQSTCTVVD